MKGIIFNLLEALVEDEEGDALWDTVLDQTNVSGVYTALGSYDDAELFALVGALAAHRDQDVDIVLHWFGRRAIPILADRYEEFFQPHTSTISFLLTLNDVIHAEVRKLYPGAEVPVFDFTLGKDGNEDTTSSSLTMVYHSHRTMCALAEGFAMGAAEHFGEAIQLEQSECTKMGADACVLSLTISGSTP
jgi:hypothetical protein